MKSRKICQLCFFGILFFIMVASISLLSDSLASAHFSIPLLPGQQASMSNNLNSIVGIYLLTSKVKAKQPVHFFIALPSRNNERVHWELFMGDGPKVNDSSSLGPSGEFVPKSYVYKSSGNFTLLLLIENGRKNPVQIYQSEIEVEPTIVQWLIQTAWPLFLTVALGLIAFILRYWIQRRQNYLFEKNVVKLRLCWLARRMLKHLQESPNTEFEEMPRWFRGEELEQSLYRILFGPYEDFVERITHVFEKKQNSPNQYLNDQHKEELEKIIKDLKEK